MSLAEPTRMKFFSASRFFAGQRSFQNNLTGFSSIRMLVTFKIVPFGSPSSVAMPSGKGRNTCLCFHAQRFAQFLYCYGGVQGFAHGLKRRSSVRK
jgi:hypothetical protein